MSQRASSFPSSAVAGLAAAVLSLGACGGEASKYSGTWSRDLYGEGEVQMNLASNGNVELMLPSPRWPDSVDMKGKAEFRGTRCCSRPTPRASACQTADARYVVSRTEESCTLPGSAWTTAAAGGRRWWGPGRSPELRRATAG